MEEEFSCSSINTEINNYSDIKTKVDNLFSKLSKKNSSVKSKYFTKIDNITTKYLDKTDKVKQKKLYTIIGYLKCENDEKLGYNISREKISCIKKELNTSEIDIDENKY
jgi:aspartyl-tRNA synthetase